MSGEQYESPANIPLLSRYTIETVELFGTTADYLEEVRAARNELIKRKINAETPVEATLALMAIAAVQNHHELLVSHQPKGALAAEIARRDEITTAIMDIQLLQLDTNGLGALEAFYERLVRQAYQE